MSSRCVIITALLVAAVMARSPVRDNNSGGDDDCLDSTEERPNGRPQCEGKHKVWLPCGEAAICPPVCGELDQECNRQTLVCVEGCQCKKGYAQLPNSEDCVKVENCPDTGMCGKNTIYKPNGLRCRESCNARKCQQSSSGNAKEAGCFCTPETARIGTECVPRDECSCPKNMRFEDCATFCTDHCDSAVMLCKAKCEQRCICNPEYAMVDGKCVPRSKCPKRAPPLV